VDKRAANICVVLGSAVEGTTGVAVEGITAGVTGAEVVIPSVVGVT
jgi:hypothetical protein